MKHPCNSTSACPFDKVAGYDCHPHMCMSDGKKVNQHCGVGLCNDTSTDPLCQPLPGCGENPSLPWSGCSAVAARQCSADARCRGFALYKQRWREGRAQFFGAGSKGVVPQGDWTAFTRTNTSSPPLVQTESQPSLLVCLCLILGQYHHPAFHHPPVCNRSPSSKRKRAGRCR